MAEHRKLGNWRETKEKKTSMVSWLALCTACFSQVIHHTCISLLSQWCRPSMHEYIYLIPTYKIATLNCSFVCLSKKQAKALVTQLCLTLCNPTDLVYQAPLSMEFSRQEHWSGLPFSSPGIFLTQGSNPGLLHFRQFLYHLNHQGSML